MCVAQLVSGIPLSIDAEGGEGVPCPFKSDSGCNLDALGNDDIEVKPSTIPGAGRGAFALRRFEEGEILGVYKCQVELRNASGMNHKYSWQLNETHACDGSPFPLENPLLYANSVATKSSCTHQNAMWNEISDSRNYVATRAILPNEEIFVDYGPAYFKLAKRRTVVYECNMSDLAIASANGDVNAVKRLFEENKVDDVDAAGVSDGWTALHEASAAGAAEVVEALLKFGATPQKLNSKGQSPLFLAALLRHNAVVTIFMKTHEIPSLSVENEGDPQKLSIVADGTSGHADVWALPLPFEVDGGTTFHADDEKIPLTDVRLTEPSALQEAAKHGDVTKIRELLERGSQEGLKELYFAARDGELELVKVLVEAGVDPNHLYDNEFAPLHVVAELGHIEVAGFLLYAAQADVNKKTYQGGTALHYAAQGGSLKMVNLLLSVPNVHNLNVDGITPYRLAEQGGHTDIMAMLTASNLPEVKTHLDGVHEDSIGNRYRDIPPDPRWYL